MMAEATEMVVGREKQPPEGCTPAAKAAAVSRRIPLSEVRHRNVVRLVVYNMDGRQQECDGYNFGEILLDRQALRQLDSDVMAKVAQLCLGEYSRNCAFANQIALSELNQLRLFLIVHESKRSEERCHATRNERNYLMRKCVIENGWFQ
ncbi:hypothetical protein SASPL_136554 [Salvia splendens]|uniref:Uncharacterized protein n=1 Tax=Salvia splendens TaxID=180675 RepID=A0A8X8ZGZ7_SALSN|nr:hypothetical protein SASPL_136554 [Salvia splendens]